MDGLIYIAMAVFIMNVGALWGMEKDTDIDRKLTIYAIPGLEDTGSEEEYLKNNVFPGYQYRRKTILIPKQICDLGQDKSTAYVVEEVEKDMAGHPEETEETTIRGMHGTSQGGVAGLKAVIELLNRASNSDKKSKPIIDFVVTEGAFGCDKNAIECSLHGNRAGNYSILRPIPFAKLWAPIAVHLLEYPHYWPTKEQLIQSIKKMPKKPVVIVINGDDDQRVPPEDVYALYYARRKSGDNGNTYVISQKGADHIRLLKPADASKVLAILEHHKLLPAKQATDGECANIDITQFQPDITSSGFKKYIEIYNRMLETQRMHEGIESAWNATKVVTGVAVTYAALRTVLEKNNVTMLRDMEKAVWNAMPHESFYVITVLSFVVQQFE